MNFNKINIYCKKTLSWISDNLNTQEVNFLFKTLSTEMFELNIHKKIFDFLFKCKNENIPVDLDIFYAFLSDNQDVNKEDVREILIGSIWKNNSSTSFNVEHYVKQIKQHYVTKLLANRSLDLHKKASQHSSTFKSPSEELKSIMDELKSHEMDDDDEIMSVGEELDLYKNEINSDLEKSKNGELKTKTQISELDKMLGGFANGDLIIVGARPSMGKTSFAISALYGMLNSKPDGVFIFFSAEVAPKAIKHKLTAVHSNLPVKLFTDFENYEEFQDLANEAIDSLHTDVVKTRLYIFDTNNKDFNFVRNKVKKVLQKHGRVDGVFFDYLQFLKTSGKNDKHIEIGEMSKDAKRLARECDMPFIMLSQLNRSLENRDDKRPIPSDLRDSGEIEQDADVIIFLYREEVYNKDMYKHLEEPPMITEAEIIIGKNRNGPTGVVRASFNKNTTRFTTRVVLDDKIDVENDIKEMENFFGKNKKQQPEVVDNPVSLQTRKNLTNLSKTQMVFDTVLTGVFPPSNDGFIRMDD